MFDEPAEMPSDLGVGQRIVRLGRSDRDGLAMLVHLYDPGRDHPARGLHDETCSEPAGKAERHQGGEPPVARLHASGSDPVVPSLRGALVGRFRRRGTPIVAAGAFEGVHERSSLTETDAEPPWWSPDRTACTAVETPCASACRRSMSLAHWGLASLGEAGAPPGDEAGPA
ncbi:hypothetical protein D3C72_1494330 [compost metagenome]